VSERNVWGWVPARGGKVKGRGCVWGLKSEQIYENRTMKPIEIVLRRGESG
jgi:hypothetical protein